LWYLARVNPATLQRAEGPVPRASPDRKIEKRLLHDLGRAIADFQLIEDGDRILVGVSGGKDSFTLLYLLQLLQRRAPVRFSLVAVNLDQGHPGFPAAQLEAYLREQRVEVRMLREDTYAIVQRLTPAGKTACAVCSRLRRGILYNAAQELSCTKIALGHHRDDLIESLLLSMLFAGKTRSMPPKLRSDDGRNTVIRPLCYAAEADIAAFAQSAAFPVIPCDLCGSQENLMRKRVKTLLTELSSEHPGVRASLFAAMGNVMPEHLLDARLQGAGRGTVPAGNDPWIDADAEDPEGPDACGAAPLALLQLGAARGET
jgi:tRNA 2-thiocytidine biosynthesis protein TtcA